MNHLAGGYRFKFLKLEANQRPDVNVIIQKTVNYFVKEAVHAAKHFTFISSAAELLIVSIVPLVHRAYG